MTRSSLQSQSLDQVLKVERPDTERKRTDLMKIQGEFRLRLRTLEKLLLQALNESTGNILDDDKVIDTLETLKREAAEITHKVEETDVRGFLHPRADEHHQSFLSVLSSIFLDIFDYVLHHNPNLKSISDYNKRRDVLLNDLFLVVYKRTSRALLYRDRVMLAVLLAQVKLQGSEEIADELEFLLESGDSVSGTASSGSAVSFLSSEQGQHLDSFAKNSIFSPVIKHLNEHEDEWRNFLESNTPELSVPAPWEPSTAALEALRAMLIIKCLRPDRLLQATAQFVQIAFNTDICNTSGLSFSYRVTGYDASYRVENIIKSTGARSSSVAMGLQEGFSVADQAIAAAARQGTWVLLKNVHLAPEWLGQLEKKLQTLNPHRNFCLFLTMEANPSIPVNILRQSRLLMNEPLPGIKANLLDSLRSITPSRLSQGPVEKVRLYFLLAWFHAVAMEQSV
ncbi:hypothetical protein D9757_010783 [Collybiopsis confluens]|uniref:Dynein heavy chain n=1 Tax=Collybiopsis confluens TaxID=2823264 RepID=A0A8H5H8L0_9AGAR|nr:hypothetical protein D9757_010783 [Collybiopsis confluens]